MQSNSHLNTEDVTLVLMTEDDDVRFEVLGMTSQYTFSRESSHP